MRLHSYSFFVALIVSLFNLILATKAQKIYNYNITASIRDVHTAQRIADLPLTLSKLQNDDWILVSNGKTGADGQLTFSSTKYEYTNGTYKIRYDVRNHYNASFYPFVDVTFQVENLLINYAFPVLLDKYGYTTYKGVFD